ncbi:MAG: TetR/AcrR family transcriptional regulator [Oscillospiraceae bacterium]|nr:TetR/AcrR family transcriptional regulator [Oscillospiraceae bacterium]
MERKTYKNVIENKKCVTFALAEIMAEKPFHEISVTEVCKKAGVSKNTFYRHFENLSDVIYQSISEVNEKLVEEAFSFRSHQVDDFIIHVCNGWCENRRLYKGFTQDETIYIIRNMTRKDIIYFFEKNNIDQGKDDLFFEFFSATFCIFLRRWCLHDFVQTPEEISGRIKNYLSGNVFEELEKYL